MESIARQSHLEVLKCPGVLDMQELGPLADLGISHALRGQELDGRMVQRGHRKNPVEHPAALVDAGLHEPGDKRGREELRSGTMLSDEVIVEHRGDRPLRHVAP